MIKPLMVVDKWIKENPAPARGLILDKVQKSPILYGVPGTVTIIYYDENLDSFSGEEKESLAKWLKDLQDSINERWQKFFVVHLERQEHVPNL